MGNSPIGKNSSDSDCDSLGKTGGSKTHTLTESELPSHTHSINHDHDSVTSGNSSISLGYSEDKRTMSFVPDGSNYSVVEDVNETNNHTHTVDLPNYTGNSGSSGSGSAHNNMPPFYYGRLHNLLSGRKDTLQGRQGRNRRYWRYRSRRCRCAPARIPAFFRRNKLASLVRIRGYIHTVQHRRRVDVGRCYTLRRASGRNRAAGCSGRSGRSGRSGHISQEHGHMEFCCRVRQ